MRVSGLTVAGMALVLGLAACGKSNEYPEGVRSVTYDACVAGFKRTAGARPGVDAAATAYCGCVIEGLQKTVPLKDFTAYDRMLATQEQSPERERIGALVSGVINMCIAEQQKKQ